MRGWERSGWTAAWSLPRGMSDAHGGTTAVGETFHLPLPRGLDSRNDAKVAGRWRAVRTILSSVSGGWYPCPHGRSGSWPRCSCSSPRSWRRGSGCCTWTRRAEMDNIGSLIVPIAIALFAISIVARGIRIVQQAQTMIIERLGKYHRTLSSGVNLVIPFIDKPRAIDWHQVVVTPTGDSFARHFRTDKIDLRETVYVFPRQNVITKDNVVVEIDALIYSQITDPGRATYETANLPDAIEKLTQTTLRNVIGEMELDHVLSSRDTINAKLRAILDEATHKWGAKVSRVELKDINPPRDIRDAMEKQMRAERDRRAAILTAEAEKQSRTLQSEGIRQSEINQAEGQKQARILAAEAEANARLKVAEAEAQAIERITAAIKGTGGDPARYLIAIRYIEALKDMVSGQNNKVIYMPFEATGVLSSLGGIREMLALGPSDKKA